MRLIIVLTGLCITASTFSQDVRIRFPKGGVYNTATANFSPNGKYVVTAQMDNSYNLWEVSTGKFLGGALYQNSTPNGYVRSKFSPSTGENPEGGKYYFIVGDMYSASIFETKTNDVVSDISTDGVLISAEFSPNGKDLLTAHWDGTAKIWDVKSGKLIRNFKKRFNLFNTLSYASYSIDGKKIITSSYDKTARIYDVETGKLLKKLKGHSEVVYESHFSPVQEGSTESEYILTESGDLSAIIWDAQTGKRLHRLIGHKDQIQKSCFSPNANYVVTASLDSTAMVWDTETGKLVHHLKGHAGEIYDVSFSPNGKFIATCSDDNSVILWDVITGQIIRRLIGHKYTVLDVDFSPISGNDSIGGKYLVTASKDGTAIIWETETGKVIQHLKSKTDGVWSISPNIVEDSIQQFAFSASDSSYYFMDYTSGKITSQFKDPLGVSHIEFINNGFENKQFLVSNQLGNELVKRSDQNEKNDLVFEGHSGIINRFHNNGKLVITAAADSTAIVWEIETGKIIHQLKGHKDEVSDALFSSDGKKIATTSYDNQTILWDAASGILLRTFVLNEKTNDLSVPVIVAFSEGGDTLSVGYSYGEIVLWNVVTGKQLNKLEGHYSGISELIFTKNGDKLLSASYDKEIILWDLISDTILTQFSHLMDVNAAFFSPNEEFVFSAVNDGSINMWNTKSGEKLLSHYFFESDPNKWVHLQPSGLFDASPEAMELMYWTKGLDVIEFAQLKDRYWVPGLWEKVMKGEALPDVGNINDIKLQPEINFGNVTNDQLPILLTKRDGGYGKVSIFINGKEVISDARGNDMDTSLTQQTLYFDIKNHPYLVDGENEIVVRASSSDGFVQGRGELFKIQAQKVESEKPSFFGVVIGVGDYVNDKIDLKFPVKDAEAVSVGMKLGAENLFGADKTFMYSVTSGGTYRPTKTNISAVFDEISTIAQAQDVIMIYLSGHGVTWGGDQGDFYFLTADATAANKEAYNDPIIRQNNAIATAEWVELLKKIPATKQVMIIDACGSGKAVDNLIAARDIETSQIKAIDRMKDRTGMYIISGCTADAVSYEASQYGQGLLTYSILEAMKGAAIRSDGSVDLDLLMQYSRDRVPVLAAGLGGIQEPQILSPKGGSIDIGILSEVDRAAIPLNLKKQVFVRSLVLNSETYEDDLGLSGLIDQELNVVGTRGDDSKIVFFDTKTYPDACKISGGYVQSPEGIELNLKIRCGENLIEKTLKAKDKNELVKLVLQVVNGDN